MTTKDPGKEGARRGPPQTESPNAVTAKDREKETTDDGAKVEVSIRFRPPDTENESFDQLFSIPGSWDRNEVTIKDPLCRGRTENTYAFNKVFLPTASQDTVFQAVARPLVDHTLAGFNSCCFAYGQTGGGKTYSIFGEGNKEKRGLLPRAIEYLFKELKKRSEEKELGMTVSFLEIYLDQIRDLCLPSPHPTAGSVAEEEARVAANNNRAGTPTLGTARESVEATTNRFSAPRTQRNSPPSIAPLTRADYVKQNLEIHEAPGGRVFVRDLTRVPVRTVQDVLEVVNRGTRLRATFETALNATSSRSHTVFSLHLGQRQRLSEEESEALAAASVSGATDPRELLQGELHLIDLAGSERNARSKSEGVRFEEARVINSSLSALGKVVLALSLSNRENAKNANQKGEGTHHIPYRDSKLTRLLQNSLGGNSYTTLLVCLNPTAANYEESLNSLQFAHRCKSVTNRPTLNRLRDPEDTARDAKLQQLQKDLQELKEELKRGQRKIFKRLLSIRNAGVEPPDSMKRLLQIGEESLATGSVKEGVGVASKRSKGKGPKGKLGSDPLEEEAPEDPAVKTAALQKKLLKQKGPSELVAVLRRHMNVAVVNERDRAARASRRALELREFVTKTRREAKQAEEELQDKIVREMQTGAELEMQASEARQAHEERLTTLDQELFLSLEAAVNTNQQHVSRERLIHRAAKVAKFISDIRKFVRNKEVFLEEQRGAMLRRLRYAEALGRLVRDVQTGVYPISFKAGRRFANIPDYMRPKLEEPETASKGDDSVMEVKKKKEKNGQDGGDNADDVGEDDESEGPPTPRSILSGVSKVSSSRNLMSRLEKGKITLKQHLHPLIGTFCLLGVQQRTIGFADEQGAGGESGRRGSVAGRKGRRGSNTSVAASAKTLNSTNLRGLNEDGWNTDHGFVDEGGEGGEGSQAEGTVAHGKRGRAAEQVVPLLLVQERAPGERLTLLEGLSDDSLKEAVLVSPSGKWCQPEGGK
uniref:Kinesin-like protein n=1 Tax=Chromera velia CCMP2878 TaxID=1169474 RepID=A0A0G4G082_9ALVE|eukprot:Cvel_19590.t1-p1 / transcript=Cvel_19590.t1 / gene=Cvel_19590 / organism=Chromera_velia_CCMP2878 / gene_product=Kinesin heavy chain, putative / transcript_product=Kinesin heavy chain, putative / location=Cvel_scaffold1702:11659-20968(-) / protein_length=991 / sequence_SO=supercontig / SO=protein_coding / is_pseudo=false